jgi:peptidyl-tRNA hydrolase
MEDNILQYIVVRKDLIDKKDLGLIIAQACHASLAPITSQMRRSGKDSMIKDSLDSESLEWAYGIFKKIILETPNEQTLKDLMDTLDKSNIEYKPIRESKMDDELTCIGIKPYKKEDIYKYLKHLKSLK